MEWKNDPIIINNENLNSTRGVCFIRSCVNKDYCASYLCAFYSCKYF